MRAHSEDLPALEQKSLLKQRPTQGMLQDACGVGFVFPNLFMNLSIIAKFGYFRYTACLCGSLE